MSKGGKRVNSNGIAMLVDLDDCLGCYGCEVACRETHRYPYDEDWMRTIRREPFVVDGKLREYHLVAPVLDKCGECFREDSQPLCMTGCPTRALFVGPVEEMLEQAEGRHCAIFMA